MYEDEISLRYYIALLLMRWKWIVLGGFIAALVVVTVTLLRPETYEATASVAVVRSRTQVSFDERIETLDDYELSGARSAADRLTALVAIAEGNEVVGSVLESVGDRLPAELQHVSPLLGIVETQLRGDLIEFTVRHENPEVAATVANSWAHVYTRQVNQIYGEGTGNVEAIATQVVAARQTYEEAQQALQEFLADKSVLELTRTLEQQLAIRQELFTAYQKSSAAIEANDASTSSTLLVDYYTDLNQIEIWLDDAETLRAQVADGSGSFTSNLGDALALIMLRGQVYGGQGPIDLQIDLANAELEPVRVADVDNLIGVLETRRQATQERIAYLTAALDSDDAESTTLADHPLTKRIDSLTDEIIELETQLETEMATRDAQRLELEAARDRTWNAFQALTDQQLEAEIKLQSRGEEVRVADLALVPATPISSGILINTVLAATIGVLIAIGIILFIDWWFAGKEPQLQGGEPAHGDDDRAAWAPGESGPVEHGQQGLADTV